MDSKGHGPISIRCAGCGVTIAVPWSDLEAHLNCSQCQTPIDFDAYDVLVDARRRLRDERKAQKQRANDVAVELREQRRAERERERQKEAADREAQLTIEAAERSDQEHRLEVRERATLKIELGWPGAVTVLAFLFAFLTGTWGVSAMKASTTILQELGSFLLLLLTAVLAIGGILLFSIAYYASCIALKIDSIRDEIEDLAPPRRRR